MNVTAEDGAFLVAQLTSHAKEVEQELVHTDKRELQAALARDLARLERLRDQVATAVKAER